MNGLGQSPLPDFSVKEQVLVNNCQLRCGQKASEDFTLVIHRVFKENQFPRQVGEGLQFIIFNGLPGDGIQAVNLRFITEQGCQEVVLAVLDAVKDKVINCGCSGNYLFKLLPVGLCIFSTNQKVGPVKDYNYRCQLSFDRFMPVNKVIED